MSGSACSVYVQLVCLLLRSVCMQLVVVVLLLLHMLDTQWLKTHCRQSMSCSLSLGCLQHDVLLLLHVEVWRVWRGKSVASTTTYEVPAATGYLRLWMVVTQMHVGNVMLARAHNHASQGSHLLACDQRLLPRSTDTAMCSTQRVPAIFCAPPHPRSACASGATESILGCLCC